jgi:hypothetical protein
MNARAVADGLNRVNTIKVVRKAKVRKPASKGRAAKAEPRKVTERTFRPEAGFRIIASHAPCGSRLRNSAR